MDRYEAALIGQYFQEQIKKKCWLNELVHNHPPINKIINTCEYCKTNGNIYVKDIKYF